MAAAATFENLLNIALLLIGDLFVVVTSFNRADAVHLALNQSVEGAREMVAVFLIESTPTLRRVSQRRFSICAFGGTAMASRSTWLRAPARFAGRA
ncbi:MAG: hypothetical protein MRY74_05330 [Neomegalonema sp.]|nr:hypothetical protein [Neomegalonema sp.]